MRVPKLTSYTVLALFLVSVPAHAQRNRDDHSVRDFTRAFFRNSWNIGLNGGTHSSGRFLLQEAAMTGGGVGERVLRTSGGFSVGVNAGVDMLERIGVRLGYSYGRSDLVFRTDNGDDSEALDATVGDVKSHVASVELIRYLLNSRSSFTPYATAGVVGSWWNIDDADAVIDGGTQFRVGGMGSVGLQFRVDRSVNLRLEAASASVRNPFTGRESFTVIPGSTLDEPARVTRSSVRLMAVYNFGRSDYRPRADRRGPRGR